MSNGVVILIQCHWEVTGPPLSPCTASSEVPVQFVKAEMKAHNGLIVKETNSTAQKLDNEAGSFTGVDSSLQRLNNNLRSQHDSWKQGLEQAHCKSKALSSKSEGSRGKMFRSNACQSKGSWSWHDFPINDAWMLKKRTAAKPCGEGKGSGKAPQQEPPARPGVLLTKVLS